MSLPVLTGAAVAGAAAVAAWGAVAPGAQLFGPTQRRIPDASAIALTFDDGPNPAVTPELLDALDRHGAKATFFLIGKHVRACPVLAEEIARRGHALGNHTETHPYLTFHSPRQIRDELLRAAEAIESAAGVRPRRMRPPYGFRGPQVHSAVRSAGCDSVVMWSRWAWDWRPQPAAPVIRRLRRVRGGDIVLLHDGGPEAPGADRRHTLEAVRHWLPRWRDAGLRLVTLGDA